MPGQSLQIGAAQMASGQILSATNAMDGINSLSVVNQTTYTTVMFYAGSAANGIPFLTVQPGQTFSIPVAVGPTIYVDFEVLQTFEFDGSVFLHIDDTPLAAAASSFVANYGLTALVGNGQIALYGGLILKWGSAYNIPTNGTTEFITYPHPFPSMVFSVVASIDTPSVKPPSLYSLTLNGGTVPANGFFYCIQGGNSNGLDLVTLTWIAIGV